MTEPRSVNILIVDDQASTRSMLRSALSGRPRTAVNEAADGDEALALIESGPPDVILCDIKMEPVDGLTLLRAIRSHDNPRIRDIPVIVMTAVATQAVVVSADKAGATSILVKPISLRILQARLDAALGA
jgi:two-component system, chemotaxis family, chemotaxis protein CheY